MRHLLHLLLLTLLHCSLHAQWREVSTPLCHTIFSLCSTSQMVFAATDVGIYRSSDNGVSWEIETSGVDLLAPPITKICANETVVLALSPGTGVYRSLDKGKSWTRVNTGALASDISSLYTPSSAVYLKQDNGLVRYSSDFGVTWFSLTSEAFKSVASSAKTFYAVTQNDSLVAYDTPNSRSSLMQLNDASSRLLSANDTAVYYVTPSGFHYYLLTSGVTKNGLGGVFNSAVDYLAGSAGKILLTTDWIYYGKNLETFKYAVQLPNSDVIAATCIAESATAMFIGSGDGRLYRSTDAGQTWSMMASGLFISAITCIHQQDNEAYCATRESGILASTDYGNSWRTANTAVVNDSLSAIHCDNPTQYRSGVRGMFRSTDKGKTWLECNDKLARLPVKKFLSRFGAMYCLLDGSIERSTNRGDTWLRCAAGLSDSTVFDYSSNDLNTFLCGTALGVFQSTDEGLSWKQFGVGDIPKNVRFVFSTDSNVFAVNAYGAIYIASKSEKNWFNWKVFSDTVDYAFANNNVIYVCSSKFGLQCSADEGYNWLQLNGDFSSFRPSCLSAVGDSLLAGFPNGTLFKCSLRKLVQDAFQDWQIVPGSSSASVNCLEPVGSDLYAGCQAIGMNIVSNNAGWQSFTKGMGPVSIQALHKRGSIVYAATYDYGLFRSADHGDWASLNADLATPYLTGVCSDSSKLYVGTQTMGVLTSIDSGKHWSYANSGLVSTSVHSLCYDSGILLAATDAGVFRSIDFGTSWQIVSSLPATSYRTALVRGKHMYAASTTNTVYVSYNTGSTWIPTAFGTKNVYTFLDDDSVAFCGTDAGVLSTRDRGITWSLYHSGLDNYSIRALARTNSYLYAGTYQHGVWFINFPKGINSSVSDEANDADKSTLTLYPDPVSNTLHLSFTMPQTDDVELRIFNNLGIMVAQHRELSLVAGPTEISYSVNSLPSGQYQCVLYSRALRARTAFVVIR